MTNIMTIPEDRVEREQLRNALIGSMRSMESTAARMEQLGLKSEARVLRADAEIAQATLDGPEALDALWARRFGPSVGHRIPGTTRTV